MRQRYVLAMLVLALLPAAVPTPRPRGVGGHHLRRRLRGLPGGLIDLAGDGEPGSGTDLANLAEAAGVFALLWRTARAARWTPPPPPPASVGLTPSPGPSPTAPAARTRSASPSGRMRPAAPSPTCAPASPSWTALRAAGTAPPTTSARPSSPSASSTAHPRRPSPGRVGRRRPRGRAPAADPAPALWPRIALGVGLLLAAAAGGALPCAAVPPEPPLLADPGGSAPECSIRAAGVAGIAELGPWPHGWSAGGSVNSTPRPREPLEGRLEVVAGEHQPWRERHQRRLGPGRGDLDPAASRAIGHRGVSRSRACRRSRPPGPGPRPGSRPS